MVYCCNIGEDFYSPIATDDEYRITKMLGKYMYNLLYHGTFDAELAVHIWFERSLNDKNKTVLYNLITIYCLPLLKYTNKDSMPGCRLRIHINFNHNSDDNILSV